MKRIVLTSCGFSSDKLKIEFKKLFNKNMGELKILYIPVAADVETGNKEWVKEEFKAIIDLGINKNNITEYSLDYDIDLKKFDFIYVLGGNTTYLLKKIIDNRFDIKLKEAIENGIIYVGSSAGSMILGSNIEADLLFDEENIYINDYTGLNIIKGIIILHYQRMNNERTRQFIKKTKDKVYTIDDGKGIFIINDQILEI